jgi:hypothetical protein
MSCAGKPGLISIPTVSGSTRSISVSIDWTTQTKGFGEYAEVNGINVYYETHGAGRPLILLHGGLGSPPATRRSDDVSGSRFRGMKDR